MRILNACDTAQALARATGRPAIVVEAVTNGSATRLTDAFPGLPDHAIGAIIDGPVTLHFDDAQAADAAFGRICQDLASECTLVDGTVTLVRPNGDTTAFEIGAR